MGSAVKKARKLDSKLDIQALTLNFSDYAKTTGSRNFECKFERIQNARLGSSFKLSMLETRSLKARLSLLISISLAFRNKSNEPIISPFWVSKIIATNFYPYLYLASLLSHQWIGYCD